jgi:hypothetical protein
MERGKILGSREARGQERAGQEGEAWIEVPGGENIDRQSMPSEKVFRLGIVDR